MIFYCQVPLYSLMIDDLEAYQLKGFNVTFYDVPELAQSGLWEG